MCENHGEKRSIDDDDEFAVPTPERTRPRLLDHLPRDVATLQWLITEDRQQSRLAALPTLGVLDMVRHFVCAPKLYVFGTLGSSFQSSPIRSLSISAPWDWQGVLQNDVVYDFFPSRTSLPCDKIQYSPTWRYMAATYVPASQSIVATGGLTGPFASDVALEICDSNSAPMTPILPLLKPRSSHVAAQVGDACVVIGGASETVPSVEVITSNRCSRPGPSLFMNCNRFHEITPSLVGASTPEGVIHVFTDFCVTNTACGYMLADSADRWIDTHFTSDDSFPMLLHSSATSLQRTMFILSNFDEPEDSTLVLLSADPRQGKMFRMLRSSKLENRHNCFLSQQMIRYDNDRLLMVLREDSGHAAYLYCLRTDTITKADFPLPAKLCKGFALALME